MEQIMEQKQMMKEDGFKMKNVYEIKDQEEARQIAMDFQQWASEDNAHRHAVRQ